MIDKSISKEAMTDKNINSGDTHPSFITYWIPLAFKKAPNMLYCDICSFQPMEIYVDDEAKLTLHGLVQVCVST